MWEIYLIFIPNKKKKKVKWWEKRVTCHYRRWEVAWLGDRSRLELWPPCPSSKWSWAELDSINNLSLSLSLLLKSLCFLFFNEVFKFNICIFGGGGICCVSGEAWRNACLMTWHLFGLGFSLLVVLVFHG